MYKQPVNKAKESYRSANALFDEFGIENYRIELIEDYPCNSKQEFGKRDGVYIKHSSCVKEYRADNQEQERERGRKKYHANKNK